MLLQESDGQWDLPGGGRDHGESSKVGVVREVAEETGYTMDSVSECPAAFWTVHRVSSAITWFAFIAYEVSVSGTYAPSVDTNDAAVDARYVSTQEALSMTLHPNARGYFETQS